MSTHDAQDRLLSMGAQEFEYKLSGDLIRKTNETVGAVTTYEYDALGTLMSVEKPDNTLVEYKIDGMGRRIGKMLDGTVVAGFLYQDSYRIVAELDGDSNITSQFVYGSQNVIPDYMIKNGRAYRIISDHLGSPRFVLDVSLGTVEQRMDYDEFGNVILDSNPGFQPFGFAGGLYDPDTRLLRFGVRDYDPATGRWATKDPMLFAGVETNLYAYVQNDPVNYRDGFGLQGSSWSDYVQTLGNAVSLGLSEAFSAGAAIIRDFGGDRQHAELYVQQLFGDQIDVDLDDLMNLTEEEFGDYLDRMCTEQALPRHRPVVQGEQDLWEYLLKVQMQQLEQTWKEGKFAEFMDAWESAWQGITSRLDQ